MFENAIDVLKSADSTLLYNTDETVSIVFLIIISLTGIFGLVVILSASTYYSHSPHGMLILSLCLSSLVVCLNTGIASVRNLAIGGLMSGQAGLDKCKTEGFIALSCIGTDMITLVLVAAERYYVIIKGASNHSKPTILAISLSWIYSIGYASSTLISGENFRIITGRATCCPNCDIPTMFPLCLFATATNFLTISAASYFYLQLYLFYRNSNKTREIDNSEEKERKLFRKFTVIIISFSILCLPFVTLFTIEALTGSSAAPILGHLSLTCWL